MKPTFTIEAFNRARNAALLSMDESRIREFMQHYSGEPGPRDPEVFWAMVHKSITAISSLPRTFRQRSKSWLTTRGLTSFDGGELDDLL